VSGWVDVLAPMTSPTGTGTGSGAGRGALSPALTAALTSPALSTHDLLVGPGAEEQEVGAAMAAEFDAFKDSRPRIETTAQPGMPALLCAQFPHPTEVDGLPDGWVIRWSTPRRPAEPAETEAPASPAAQMFVVERLAGGWGVLMHAPYGGIVETIMRSKMWNYVTPTVAELYEASLRSSRFGFTEPEEAIRALVLSCYNTADPTEEAEATLVGLGGPITVFPSSLT
jgi:hypothetical protein